MNIYNKLIPTHFTGTAASLLDLIIVKKPDVSKIVSFNQVSIPGVSNHDLIYCSYSFPVELEVKIFSLGILLHAI